MRQWAEERGEFVDAIVCDSPYEIGFMGKEWDKRGVAFDPETWRLALDVMKPGAHLLAFGGTRTHHRLMVAIEDAGFEIRDCLMWLYGSGFPKSLDVSKAIDKAEGVEREVVGKRVHPTLTGQPVVKSRAYHVETINAESWDITAPATALAQIYDGWGTALKPAYEIVVAARKPLGEQTERDTITENLLRLEARLWSLFPVSFVIDHLMLSQAEYNAACDFAQWSAEEKRNTLDGLSVTMDTQWFQWMANTCLSIVMSWNSILAENWKHTNTSITNERESSFVPTIELKTLKSCMSELTPSIIIKAAMGVDGLSLNALPVARLFSAVNQSMNAIRELSALDRAMSQEATSCPEGEGLSPAYEPIILARKPLIGSVAENVIEHGTGGLNIDGCRIETSDNLNGGAYSGGTRNPISGETRDKVSAGMYGEDGRLDPSSYKQPAGRWPANLILDEESAAMLDEQSGNRGGGFGVRGKGGTGQVVGYGDAGGASRFFYCAKASRSERNAGLDSLPDRFLATMGDGIGKREHNESEPSAWVKNNHPTVKPIALMRYLLRLVTPLDGIVIDPFLGSGSTGCAVAVENNEHGTGWQFIGADLDEHNVEIARKRIAHHHRKQWRLL